MPVRTSGVMRTPSFFDDEHGYWKLDWHGGPPVDPDQSTADPSRGQPELDRVSDYIRRHVRWVEPTPARTTPCMYTMTLDQEFIIDSLPGRPAIAVGAGFSGHGESSNGLSPRCVSRTVAANRLQARPGRLSMINS